MSYEHENSTITIKLLGYVLVSLITYLLLNDFSLSVDKENLILSTYIGIILYEIWDVILDKWLWKLGIVKSILNIKVPYVQGRWVGQLKSSYDNFHNEFPIVIEIQQTYRSMKITYYDRRAISHILVSKFIIEESLSPKLFCIYRNEPVVATIEQFQIHYGTMILNFQNNKEIKGTYFNNFLQRKTYGELSLGLETRKLKFSF
jgi:hypothetical protein